jgi:tRNA (mo5U34)-methyltransferase
MDASSWQTKIQAIRWYHELDFGQGLKTQSAVPEVALHRRIWQFIENQLNGVDFQGKSVLDIGCWDGYWSFYAERRGARSVLATDDRTQNRSDSQGIFLAKEILGSRIEINLDLSIYELSRLQRQFDIIMCFGVYYHLIDPFHAFAQIRHCCHDDSLVLLEGDGLRSCDPQGIHFNLSEPSKSLFVPTAEVLKEMLEGDYFSVTSQEWMPDEDSHRPGIKWRLAEWAKGWLAPRLLLRPHMNRLFSVCRPYKGNNPRHYYKPPFGLHVYDDRFSL